MREMKDSGIEWIGEIPKKWNVSSLLYLLRGSITDGPHETPNLIDNGIPFISVDSLNESEDIDFSVVKKFISEEDYKRYNQKANLEEGDILFSKAATIGKTAIVKDEKFMVWSPLAIIKVNEDICFNKYVYYVLNCDGLIIYVSMLGSYNTQINVGMRELEKAIVPYPSLKEQKIIADFLDSKCSDIDALTSDIKSQIDILEQYKRSVITEAVTKGLNPDVEMKDSGVEWIGEIPKDWSLKKIKYCLQERIEKNNPVKTTNILSLTAKQGVIPHDQKEGGGNKPKEDVSAYHLAYPGDIVMNSMNILSGAVGLSSYFGCVSPVYYMLRPLDENEDVRFYNYIFQTTVFQRSLYGLGNGILMKESSNGKLNTIRMRIPMDKFGQLFIPVASYKEQNAIADYLDDKCSDIDAIIADKQAQLDTLTEYKKSLIYEYVTGKKEVPAS